MIRDRNKELVRIRAGDLIPNPRNWRRHPKAQADAMRGVLADVGFAGAAIARQTPEGLMLLDGHLRAELDPEAIISVIVLDDDVTDEDAAKILLTHDPLGAMAETGSEALASLLAEASFDDGDVLKMLDGMARAAKLSTAKAGLTDPDAVPATPDEPTTKPGDLWLMGDHRLLCGDATKDAARLMGGGMAAAMWTDPPYGVEYVGKTKDALTIQNDGAEGLAGLLAGAFAQATTALEPGAPFYIARPPGALSVTFGCAILGAGWQLHEELQWVKDSMVLGHSDYHVRHETIVYGWVPGPGRSGRGKHEGSRWYGDNSQTTVFEIPRPKASPDHPTGKPVDLVERHLANSSERSDVIYEPFSGSGTTLIACERLGRRCYAIEIEPRYVDVAVRRWEQYTGQRAVLDGRL